MWNNLLKELKELPAYAFNTVLALTALLSGLLFKGLATLVLRLYSKSNTRFSIFRAALKRLNGPFTFFLPLIILNLFLPLMRLEKAAYSALDKTTGILLIVVFAWVLISIIKIAEDYVYHYFNLKQQDNLRERKIRTQLQFLRRVVILLIILLAACAILLSFNNLRRLGTGLLTGVGISGLVVGFAAQRSLGNLLAGFQIAFTQPIRIDDVLVVEGEWGRVEEINLTYVVLNIWDQRRLILPINYFIEKPFQNWTRSTAEILGTAFLYLDYSAPVDLIRIEFLRILETSPLWDKRAGALQVTNSSEKTIELRALMSAANSGDVFNLRCLVREKLIDFVSKNYPESLPKTRAVTDDFKNIAGSIDGASPAE